MSTEASGETSSPASTVLSQMQELRSRQLAAKALLPYAISHRQQLQDGDYTAKRYVSELTDIYNSVGQLTDPAVTRKNLYLKIAELLTELVNEDERGGPDVWMRWAFSAAVGETLIKPKQALLQSKNVTIKPDMWSDEDIANALNSLMQLKIHEMQDSVLAQLTDREVPSNPNEEERDASPGFYRRGADCETIFRWILETVEAGEKSVSLPDIGGSTAAASSKKISATRALRDLATRASRPFHRHTKESTPANDLG